MSALPPKADINGRSFDVCFVPEADIQEREPLFGVLRASSLLSSWAADRHPGSAHLEIGIAERLAVVVTHDKAGVQLLDRPGGGKRRGGIAGQCTKLLFAHKGRFNACWTN